MALNFSAAHSSRITNRSPLKRSSSSLFANVNERKPVRRMLSEPECVDEYDGFNDDCLNDIGSVRSLATDPSSRDVVQVIHYTRSQMFDTLPENGGFKSTNIADILNFRKSMPPTVTVAHVHAMIGSATATERDIAALATTGIIRKIVIPGRGIGGSSVEDSLILLQDIERLTSEAKGLDPSLADKLLDYLRANPMGHLISSRAFSTTEIMLLMRAGFLASFRWPSQFASVSRGRTPSFSGTMTSISSISKAASGTMGAVGGEDAIYDVGGRRSMRRNSSHFDNSAEKLSQHFCSEGEDFTLSLPNVGPYLKLLISARSHLVSLLMKSKSRQMPLYLLRERWDGGIPADHAATRAKKYRRGFDGVLPSKTRKWKQFYGLSIDWVLAECVGAGLVEVFETGSVGRAVRIV